MKIPPKISVIMSAYNAEKYLYDSVNSILHQKGISLELIVINDGSEDNTLSILKDIGSNDDRLKIIDKKNEGLPIALNLAIKASQGEYLARMYADDIADGKRLSKQAAILDINNEIDILGTFVKAFGDGKERIWKYPVNDETCKVALLFINPIAHPTVMFRRRVIENIGLYDTSYDYDQDYELWARASASFGISNLALPLLRYRIHKNQMGSVYSKSERITSQKRTQLFLLNEMGFYPSDEEMELYLKLANGYRLEFDMPVDLLMLKKLSFLIKKIITTNKHSQRYSESALIERCLIQYQSLCLYSANIGISVYNEFKILAESLGKKRKYWLLLFSCIFKLGRKEHLIFYNIINKLKVL
jgi:glycosyltransferase involved in cell wall biosynthesis